MLDALATARQVVVHLAPQHQGSQGEAASPMPYDSLLSPTTLQLGRIFVIVIVIGGELDAAHSSN
jgi:hypothetical protein